MNKKIILGVVALAALFTVIWFFQKEKVQKVRDIKQGSSQIQTEPSEDAIKNLPETSAIKQAVKVAENNARHEKEVREEILRRWHIYNNLYKKFEFKTIENREWSENGKSYIDGISQAIKYPSYPRCVQSHLLNNNQLYIFDRCVFESFIVDRLAPNNKLQNAFDLAGQKEVKLLLSSRFEIGAKWISIDVNASDQIIIDFLTKNTKVAKSN